MKLQDLSVIFTALAAVGFFFFKISEAGSVAAGTGPEVLRAQRIELVDERGVERARLSTESNGDVVLRLLGAGGEVRVKLAASDEGSGLLLANSDTEPGVHILATRTATTLKLREGKRERVIEP